MDIEFGFSDEPYEGPPIYWVRLLKSDTSQDDSWRQEPAYYGPDWTEAEARFTRFVELAGGHRVEFMVSAPGGMQMVVLVDHSPRLHHQECDHRAEHRPGGR